MKSKLFAAVVLSLCCALPAAAARRGAQADGAAMPSMSVADLTAGECRKLGGKVETIGTDYCKSGSQCRSVVKNPQTGNIEVHGICLDEKVK